MSEQALQAASVDYRVEEAVAWITINRPDRMNAIDTATRRELGEATKQAERDAAVRCVVLTGAGDRAFSAGADIREMGEGGEIEIVGRVLRDEYGPILVRLRTMPKPVIAAVNGVAAGVGVSFAMAADIRLAVEHARFIEAFVGIGLVGDGGATWLLPRLVGTGKAMEMLMTGAPLSATDAERFGLVNQVLPAASFRDTVREWATRLAAGPTGAIAANKRAVNHALGSTFEEAIEFESYLQQARIATADFAEGVAAFTEKRPPKFGGG